MAFHAKDTLGSSRIAKVVNLAFAVAALEAGGTESLVARKDRQFFDLLPAGTTAIGTVVADKGPVPEHQEVRVRVKKGSAAVAAEAFDVPPITG